MTLDDTPEEAAYRAAARRWIVENAPDLERLSLDERRVWQPRHREVATAWQALKATAGYACIAWPTAWGGAGGTQMQEAIFAQEESRAGLSFPYFMTGLQMLLPALLQFNSDPRTLALVPPAVRGETIWCQLFSEPFSGSDSAAARCSAVRDGDDWVLNGQKVWNSGAHQSDFGLVVTRTDPDALKHKGMTVFWIDMRNPGLEVRPIKMMTGDSEFDEVFLTNVRVSDAQRVGEVGEGWKVILATLANERAAIGAGRGPSWREIMRLARETSGWNGPVMQDTDFRDWLADWYVGAEAVRLLGLQSLSQLSHGEAPGPEGAAGKLLWASLSQQISSQALDVLGVQGLIDDPKIAAVGGVFHQRFMWAPALRLGGGTDEILKTLIAERVLGLPSGPRADKGVPFKDIPIGPG